MSSSVHTTQRCQVKKFRLENDTMKSSFISNEPEYYARLHKKYKPTSMHIRAGLQ